LSRSYDARPREWSRERPPPVNMWLDFAKFLVSEKFGLHLQELHIVNPVHEVKHGISTEAWAANFWTVGTSTPTSHKQFHYTGREMIQALELLVRKLQDPPRSPAPPVLLSGSGDLVLGPDWDSSEEESEDDFDDDESLDDDDMYNDMYNDMFNNMFDDHDEQVALGEGFYGGGNLPGMGGWPGSPFDFDSSDSEF
jgi:hypothetical protein